jgi:hypothetical protein
MHNTPQQNEAFRKAFDATNARWFASMTHTEIIDYYDNHPNLTLAELSRMTMLSVKQLKNILMGQA